MKLITFFCCLLIAVNTFSQIPEEQPLYPNGIKDNPVTHPKKESYVDSLVHPKSLTGLNRVYSYVSEPTYMIFPANKENNKNIGLVILPGGGLRNVWLDKEGTDIALWLSEQGVTCMVVKYRTNRREHGKFAIDMDDYKPAVYQDVQTSMIKMKALSDSLGFDKDKVGMIGFSAGGWILDHFLLEYYEGNNDWYPDFASFVYYGNHWTKKRKLKDKDNLPPFFIAIARNDYRLGVKRVMPYLTKIALSVDKSELHVYGDGGHGFGLAYDENSSVKGWKYAFVNWLDSLY